MKEIMLSEEFRRMQKLAGIQINEDTQEVVLYASWVLNTPEARKEGIADESDISEDNIPSSFSGNTTPNGNYGSSRVILCTNHPWTLVSETDKVDLEDIKILIVKFKKPLTDVFLDDDFYIEDFGIDEEPDLDYSKEIPLSELVPYGLDTKGKWYGCYVNNISSDEIISKKVGFQNEDMGGGEWSSF
jgi:hypothetical protein